MKFRFSDSKWTEGKLKFFLSLCEKLKHDMGEFAEILAPSRKGFQQIIVKLCVHFVSMCLCVNKMSILCLCVKKFKNGHRLTLKSLFTRHPPQPLPPENFFWSQM